MHVVNNTKLYTTYYWVEWENQGRWNKRDI